MIAALSGESSTKQNPLQDLQDEDDIVEILGANQQYIDELELIRNRKESESRSQSDSNGTTKIKDSQSGDDDVDDHEDSESDSMDSAERREIARRKEAERGRGRDDGDRSGSSSSSSSRSRERESEHLEASLMEQQMAMMVEQEKWALDRTVSGRKTFKMEDAAKWKSNELQHEMDAMKAMHRRLSSGSWTIDEIQQEAQQQMAAFHELKDSSSPQIELEEKGQSQCPKGTLSVTAPSRIPSKADEDFDLLLDVKPTIDGKTMPPKSNKMGSTLDVDPLSGGGSAANTAVHDEQHSIPNAVSIGHRVGMHPISPQDVSMTMTMSPVTATGHSAASSGSFGMAMGGGSVGGGGGSNNGSRRNSYSHEHSISHSHSMSHSQHSTAMRISGADISQYTASGGGHHHLMTSSSSERRSGSNPMLRLLRWYLGPLHRKDTVLRIGFHGVNAVLSMTAFVAMAAMTVLAVGLTPLCGLGLLFLYFECAAARRLVAVDARCCHYLFGAEHGHRAPVLFALSPAASASEGMVAQLKLFVSDPQTVSMVAYFLLLKLPAAVLLSGSSLVMLSGVCSILMSPMVYWLQPDYFQQDRLGLTSMHTLHSML